MGTALEDLRILQVAEKVADAVWKRVVTWDTFARDVVGGQLARAADSIGANIAEAFGRFHYGDRLKFLYYARGSLFETKYWLNRASARQLMSSTEAHAHIAQLTDLALQLNLFANSLKAQQRDQSSQPKAVRESILAYVTNDSLDNMDDMLAWLNDPDTPLFTAFDLEWLQSPNLPIS